MHLIRRAASAASLLFAVPAALAAQSAAVARVEIQPTTIAVDVNGTSRVTARAVDAAGATVAVPIVFTSLARRNVTIDSTGLVTGLKPGTFKVVAMAMTGAGAPRAGVRGEATVEVRWPAIRTVEILGGGDRYYAGTTVRHTVHLVDASGAERTNVPVRWSSDAASIATADEGGNITFLKPGRVTIAASGGGVSATRAVTVLPNPARSIALTASASDARMGDVVHFAAVAHDAAGKPVDLPVTLALKAQVEDTVIASEPPAEVDQDGSFVAQRAGLYTVVATAGNLVATKTVHIGHRYTSTRMSQAKGHGSVTDVHTSDIWVWHGKDGRDYAITGTWGAAGKAYFWDVTDPANLIKTDSIQVDARTTNDVKVDEARELCIVTREGASNRRNGFVVVDCHDPRHVQILSTFDDGLLGGVHNTFVWNKHVFAINAGTRFDIISIEDPKNPKRVGVFELSTPGHGIHDVWVVDGIAYASQWQDGLIMVDVGGGGMGGSLAHPVQMTSYKYPIGATHSAFPYHSKTANKFYVFVGDEQFPHNLPDTGPDEAGGYIHIVDFTDLKHPMEVARYQVPEAGPHNFWVENDTLYVAYYNAGLRVVDVSGELKGNLYTQGRELVRFSAYDPKGYVANQAMAWGPQPFKGHVFFSDHNSGIWSVKLPERTAPLTP